MTVDDMEQVKHQDDYKFAQRICKELRAGRTAAIKEVYSRYKKDCRHFLRCQAKGETSKRIEDIWNRFWLELLNGNAICGFTGRMSLRSLFFKLINYRIQDEWRRVQRDRRGVSPSSFQEKGMSEDEFLSAAAMDSHDAMSAEDQMIIKQRDQIIRKTLLNLAETDPIDANLVKMHLKEMTYGAMAARELAGRNSDHKTLERRRVAIKKRFTRPDIGSMVKFKKMLLKNMEKFKYDIDDLLD